MSYSKIHKTYVDKFGELPFSIRDINYTEVEDQVSELLQDAIMNNEKLTDEQLKQVIEMPEIPEDAKI